ncbi:hypothetical protein ABZ957_15070 [Streptomyces sp. NPDC046316]|uniref:hypothetical protein n=1 Tax=Streptomyces sp. NPDC046316 TaxID=3154494 RepID=UPI0033CC26A3
MRSAAILVAGRVAEHARLIRRTPDREIAVGDAKRAVDQVQVHETGQEDQR